MRGVRSWSTHILRYGGIWDRSERGVRSWSIHILRYGELWDRSVRGVRSWFTHTLRYGGYGAGKIMFYPHTQIQEGMGKDTKGGVFPREHKVVNFILFSNWCGGLFRTYMVTRKKFR